MFPSDENEASDKLAKSMFADLERLGVARQKSTAKREKRFNCEEFTQAMTQDEAEGHDHESEVDPLAEMSAEAKKAVADCAKVPLSQNQGTDRDTCCRMREEQKRFFPEISFGAKPDSWNPSDVAACVKVIKAKTKAEKLLKVAPKKKAQRQKPPICETVECVDDRGECELQAECEECVKVNDDDPVFQKAAKANRETDDPVFEEYGRNIPPSEWKAPPEWKVATKAWCYDEDEHATVKTRCVTIKGNNDTEALKNFVKFRKGCPGNDDYALSKKDQDMENGYRKVAENLLNKVLVQHSLKSCEVVSQSWCEK